MASKQYDALDADVVVLHAGPRPVEVRIRDSFLSRDVRCALVHVEELKDLGEFPVNVTFLNRVPPSSVFEHNLSVIELARKAVERLESSGRTVINGLQATMADYSKNFAAKLLSDARVRTPKTVLLSEDTLQIKPPFLPMVIKLDTGGFGREMAIVNTPSEWEEYIETQNWKFPQRILQEFIPSKDRVHICPTIMFGNVVSVSIRLLSEEWGETKVRSISNLSAYNISGNVIDLALQATHAIRADINAVDMVVDRLGPVIIENNPTPAFSAFVHGSGDFDPVETLCQKTLDWLSTKGN